MTESLLQSIDVGTGTAARRIAVRLRDGTAPGLVWLGGFKSDMQGTKAVALDAWAGEQGRACIRFDYSGHGESGGDFADGTIGRWLEESVAVFERFAKGPQVLVGSSMGGWLALLLARELKRRSPAGSVAGMVLIAPAVDFTEELMWQKVLARGEAADRDRRLLAAAVAVFGERLSDHARADRGGAQPSPARRADRDRMPGAHPAGRAGSRRAVAARGRTCRRVWRATTWC